MLLEIENKLYQKVHEAVGHSARVIRLAEELDRSGTVSEQTSIVVSFVSASTENPHEGAYIPTVRKRKLTYTVTIICKQAQRSGHSFALPLLDLTADAVTGWVPEIQGLQFHTGFELRNERFAQITEASQYIYEQTYEIQVTIHDGRFYSAPCAAFSPIKVCDYLPQRRCLLTESGIRTGLAIWRRKINAEEYEEWIVKDPTGCETRPCDTLELFPGPDGTCKGTFRFTPCEALEENNNGEVCGVNPSLVVEGEIENVWQFCHDSDRPPWFKFNIEFNLWRSFSVESAKKCTSCKVPLNPRLLIDTYGD